MSSSSESLLLAPEEAADLLRIGRTRLYGLLAAGDIPSVKLGGSRRISRAALERYVDALTAPHDDARLAPVAAGWQHGRRPAGDRPVTRRPLSEPPCEALPLLLSEGDGT